MRILIVFCFALFAQWNVAAQNKVIVKIINFESNVGKAQFAIYDKESGFLEKDFKNASADIVDGKSKAVFHVPDGTYAVAVFHDEDSDEEMDTFLKIPKEDYGFSNNTTGSLGPPKWKDASFSVENGETVIQIIEL
jgi:uncharacterized protein (DUF2141 family)